MTADAGNTGALNLDWSAVMQELDCPQKGWIVCQAIGTELCKVGLFVGLSRNRCKNNNCICTSAFVGKVCVECRSSIVLICCACLCWRLSYMCCLFLCAADFCLIKIVSQCKEQFQSGWLSITEISYCMIFLSHYQVSSLYSKFTQ